MGTDYRVAQGVELSESSCEVQFALQGQHVQQMDDGSVVVYSARMTAQQLREAIIRQVEVLSYISDDPEKVLKRFNVDYGQTE